MNNAHYYVLVALLFAAFALRGPGVLRYWRDPLVRSVSVLLPLAAAVFFFAAPPTVAKVNALTGVANFSAPLVYGIVAALSAALVNLTITWRGGPEERRRSATRWCVGAYGVLIATLFTLFALGEAPDERLRDFDTYYANTPFVREMIVLYLLAHASASAILASLCRRWARDVAGLLRVGLLIIVYGSALALVYDTCKLAAVGARWTDHDWDVMSTTVAPVVASVASLFQCVGLALPSVGHGVARQWRAWSQYKRLGPLWRITRAVTPYELVRLPWWSSLGKRHLRRTCDIRDGLRLLTPYLERETEPAGEFGVRPDGGPSAQAAPGRGGGPTGAGGLAPGSARYVSLVVAAYRTLRPGAVDPGSGGFETMLQGDDDKLVRLSDAVRVLAVLDAAPDSPRPPATPRRAVT
ncbi:MAB_1171c family putative transporter [Streptomyces sp. NPDC048606]|uniref:MAB_1171c family putative transporter n=1 Tax=Streptomyces sp. NPDC048606 TaxID=3154726 RepID=UPI0034483F81